MKDNKEHGAGIFKVDLTNANGESQGSTFILSETVVSDTNKEVDLSDENLNGPAVELGGRSISTLMPGTKAALTHTHANRSKTFSTGGDGYIIKTDETTSKRTGLPIYMSHKGGKLLRQDFNNNNGPKIIHRNIPTN